MIKKIAILGSTGSIGKTVLQLVKKKKIEIIFLAANRNYKKLFYQAKIYNVKNLIICDLKSYKKALIYNKNKKIKIYNNFVCFKKILKGKLDYVMSSISGIDGLTPTFNIIKYTKKIAIANKESLICAWPIIKKELIRNKTQFIPVDSEHFSIWSEIKNVDTNAIKKIYITASGGPLLNYDLRQKKKIPLSKILKHPTWKMGKKITVDSATMMNKCFEVMEAKNLFDLKYNQIDILIHPQSYVHAIIVYKNGISKIVAHETTMKIPIFNTIFSNNQIYSHSNRMIDINKLNNINLKKILIAKFPIIKILKGLPTKHSFFETVVVSVNDFLVDKFLQKKIKFQDITNLSIKFINHDNFKKLKKNYPQKINDIINLNRKIKLNLNELIN